MKKKITFLALVLALIAAPSYTDVTTKSNLNRALADALYCQLTGCTMTGNFYGSGGTIAYIGPQVDEGAGWMSGVTVYGDGSAGNIFSVLYTPSPVADSGPFVNFDTKIAAAGGYKSLGYIQFAKLNATDNNDASYIRFVYHPTTGTTNTFAMDANGFRPLAAGTNTYDLGYSNAQWRSIYAGGGLTLGYVAKTATYTATANDYTIAVTPAAATTINIPAAASNTGRIYVIRKMDASANAVTIDPNGAETINGAATYVVPNTTAVTIQCTGSAWIIISLT